MCNRTGYLVIVMLCLSTSLFHSGKLTAQSEMGERYNADAPLVDDVPTVSARIATLYKVDIQIVERYVQAAVNLESRIGIAAPVVIAIAIHESSFKSELFVNAGNPFGIKASAPWVGPTYSKWDDGKETKFRVYGSPEEAIWDFGTFVKSRIWYADVLDCPIDDARCVIDGLKKTEYELGYSTNPNWDEAIMDIIQKLELLSLATN
jgi:flagellum-specific peptidoglycan hydrolase FlgJ